MHKQPLIQADRLKTKVAFVTLSLCCALSVIHHTAQAESDFHRNALLNPGQAMLLAESKGRVTIYDSLDYATVERAMDEQFGRIEHMMFVRTRYLDDDGNEVGIDDDCD